MTAYAAVMASVSPSARRQMRAGAVGAVFGAGAGLALLPASDGGVAVLGGSLLAAAMAAIGYEDALRFRIPDAWVYGALAAGLAYGALMLPGPVWSLAGPLGAFVSAALCGGAFLAVREGFFRLRGIDGLGLGDVKLAAAGGAWLGTQGFAFAVLAATAGAVAFVLLRAMRGAGWSASQRIAFGAFLAPAIWLAWLGQHLWIAHLGILGPVSGFGG